MSLRVLARGLRCADLIWYTLIYGDHDDNVLALGVEREVAGSLEIVAYAAEGPMRQALDDQATFEEYQLTAEVRSAVGLSIQGNSFQLGSLELLKKQIYVHDDCFFLVHPVNDAERVTLVQAILEQHSFYLCVEVRWEGVLREIVDLMKTIETLRIESKPRRREVVLSWDRSGTSTLKSAFQRRESREIKIHDGEAKFL